MENKTSAAPPIRQPTLVKHYRAIGPAAIVAALLHTTHKKKPGRKTTVSCNGDED